MFYLTVYMFSYCLLYLFLVGSHQLYAEFWLDFFAFAGPLGGVRTTTSLAMLLYLCLYCIFRLFRVVSCCHCLGTCLHFCTYATCLLFFFVGCTPSLDKYCTIDNFWGFP